MTCETAEAAVAAVTILPVALAILDFELPGTTGAELAKALRALRPHLPLVLMSGRADLTQTQLQDFDGICPKGEHPSLLFRTIAGLLEARHISAPNKCST